MTETTPNYQAITTARTNHVQRTKVLINGNSSKAAGGGDAGGAGGGGGPLAAQFRERRHSVGHYDIKIALESRKHSKKEMQSLNERLANHIEKTRYLQSKNRQLNDEINGLKGRWGKETEKIRQMYDVELKQLRRLVDETERLKSEKDVKIASYEKQNGDMREQLQESVAQVEAYSERLQRLNHELSDRDGEISLMRRQLMHLEEDKVKSRKQLNKMKEEMSRLNGDLDGETAARLGAQAENQTLHEELEFRKRIHDQEMKELQTLIKKDDDGSRDFWRNEMGQAIHDIMKEYDEKVDHVRSELETMYLTKIRELAKNQHSNNPEIAYLRDENKTIKGLLSNTRGRLAELQSKNDHLERVLQETQQEFEQERRQYIEEQQRFEKEQHETEADLRRVLSELQVLLDTKLSLELEITAYKQLMDSDDMKSLDKGENTHQQSNTQSQSFALISQHGDKHEQDDEVFELSKLQTLTDNTNKSSVLQNHFSNMQASSNNIMDTSSI